MELKFRFNESMKFWDGLIVFLVGLGVVVYFGKFLKILLWIMFFVDVNIVMLFIVWIWIRWLSDDYWDWWCFVSLGVGCFDRCGLGGVVFGYYCYYMVC